MLLTERLLPREDHGNLYVAASFGTFAVSLPISGQDIRIKRRYIV